MGGLDSQQDFKEIPLKNVVLEQLASDPTPTQEGRIWTRTDLDLVKVYLGGLVKSLITSDDTRLTDSRTPSGAAGGDLLGSTYPNPTIAANTVGLSKLNAVVKPVPDGGSAVAGDLALRAIGTGVYQAMAGNTRLDTIAAPTASVSLNSQRITNLSPSAAGTDAVNRNELDAARQGLAGAKDPVRVVAPGNVTIATPGANIDGVAMVAGDRFLAPAQTTTTQDGIYVWNGAAVAATRAPDADAAGEIKDGTTAAIAEGTKAGYVYIQNATPVGAPGAWSEDWVPYATGGIAYTWGAGLGISGSDVFVNVDNASIEISSDALRVKASGILNSMIANATIDLTTKVTGILPIVNGGTGASTAAAARTNLGAMGGVTIASPALTTGTWTDITHNLGVVPKIWMAKLASNGEEVGVDIREKAGSTTTVAQMKIDIVGGRAAAFYNVSFIG